MGSVILWFMVAYIVFNAIYIFNMIWKRCYLGIDVHRYVYMLIPFIPSTLSPDAEYKFWPLLRVDLGEKYHPVFKDDQIPRLLLIWAISVFWVTVVGIGTILLILGGIAALVLGVHAIVRTPSVWPFAIPLMIAASWFAVHIIKFTKNHRGNDV